MVADLDDNFLALETAVFKALQHLPGGDDSAPPCSGISAQTAVKIHGLAGD